MKSLHPDRDRAPMKSISATIPRPEIQISMERARLWTPGVKCQRNLRNSPGRNCWKSALSGSGASWPPGGALCWNPAKSYEICWVQQLVPHTRSNWCCEIHSVRELNARETSGQEPVQGKSLEVKYLFFLCCSTSNLWPSSKSHPPTKYKYLKSPALFSEEEKRVHLELR